MSSNALSFIHEYIYNTDVNACDGITWDRWIPGLNRALDLKPNKQKYSQQKHQSSFYLFELFCVYITSLGILRHYSDLIIFHRAEISRKANP